MIHLNVTGKLNVFMYIVVKNLLINHFIMEFNNFNFFLKNNSKHSSKFVLIILYFIVELAKLIGIGLFISYKQFGLKCLIKRFS